MREHVDLVSAVFNAPFTNPHTYTPQGTMKGPGVDTTVNLQSTTKQTQSSRLFASQLLLP
jgi:hypothetical protein